MYGNKDIDKLSMYSQELMHVLCMQIYTGYLEAGNRYLFSPQFFFILPYSWVQNNVENDILNFCSFVVENFIRETVSTDNFVLAVNDNLGYFTYLSVFFFIGKTWIRYWVPFPSP